MWPGSRDLRQPFLKRGTFMSVGATVVAEVADGELSLPRQPLGVAALSMSTVEEPLAGVVRATAQLLELAMDERRRLVIARALGGLAAALPRVSPDHLAELAAEETDYAVLVSLCQAPAGLDAWHQADPFAAARQRAAEVKQRLLEAEGGAEPVSAVAERLGLSRQAVDKRWRRGQLLAFELPQGRCYPRWQFAGDRVLDGLSAVLAALEGTPWEKASWFLSSNPRLGDARPVDVLRRPSPRRSADDVLRAAAAEREYGAG
jgi:hypothetical protein